MSRGRTSWTVEHDGILGKVRIVLETDDREIVGLVEESAQKHGLRLARLLETLEPESPADGPDRDQG
jgi:hypothetical protein